MRLVCISADEETGGGIMKRDLPYFDTEGEGNEAAPRWAFKRISVSDGAVNNTQVAA